MDNEYKLEFKAKHWDSFLSRSFPTARSKYTDEMFNFVWNQYSISDRSYHNISHIENCFDTFSFLLNSNIYDIEALTIAIWFHDVIYDSRQNNNEEQSAILAKAFCYALNCTEEFSNKVEQLILFTKHNKKASTVDEKIISDVDLAILSSSPLEFWDYSKGIRQEYSWAPDIVYYPNRLKFLENLLLKKSIYYTKNFNKSYKQFPSRAADAKSNIALEIKYIKGILNK